MTDPSQHDAELPEALVAALCKADQPPPTITSRVDHALQQMAAEQFAARSKPRRNFRLWYAAAASVLGIAIILQMQPARESTDLLFTDVDGSGQVDIADVLVLASRGGGKYSQDELDAFAMHVVSLGDES